MADGPGTGSVAGAITVTAVAKLDGDGAFAGEGLVGPAGADAGVEVGSGVQGRRQPGVRLHVGDVADEEVITWSAVDQVAVLTAEQTVVASPAEHGVGAEATADEVVAAQAQDDVVAVPGDDDLRPGGAAEDVVAGGAEDCPGWRVGARIFFLSAGWLAGPAATSPGARAERSGLRDVCPWQPPKFLRLMGEGDATGAKRQGQPCLAGSRRTSGVLATWFTLSLVV